MYTKELPSVGLRTHGLCAVLNSIITSSHSILFNVSVKSFDAIPIFKSSP